MKITLRHHHADQNDPHGNYQHSEMSELKQELLRSLSTRFVTIRQRNSERNIIHLELDYRELIPVTHYLRHYTGFVLLQLISCVDWDEDNTFQMTYFIWNQDQKLQLLLSFRIVKNSEIPIPSVITIWPHAETFERELREMFGVIFDGNPRQDEPFLLEDWEGPPPMLREFDTQTFSNERFGERPGRYSEDTRRYIGKKVGEYDFSWPVSGE